MEDGEKKEEKIKVGEDIQEGEDRKQEKKNTVHIKINICNLFLRKRNKEPGLLCLSPWTIFVI